MAPKESRPFIIKEMSNYYCNYLWDMCFLFDIFSEYFYGDIKEDTDQYFVELTCHEY